MQHKSSRKKWLKLATLIFTFGGVLLTGVAFAAGTGTGPDALTLGGIAKTVDTSVTETAVILTDAALLAGIGFVLASFFKFHQHKLNPTQVPLSQGITLLLIGAGLMLFPTLIPTASKAVFGTAKVATVSGNQIVGLIGGTKQTN